VNLAVTRTTVQEAVSRRLVVFGLVLTAAFVALFALGFWFLYSEVVQASAADRLAQVFAGALLTVLGLYVASFMGSFLALLVSAGAVSGEIDSGTVQVVLARPLRRASWLLQRWLGCALLVAVYTVVLATALLLIARSIADYQALHAVRAVALMVLQAQLLLALGILGSTRLPAVANGVVLFFAFGISWLAGIVEFVGEGIGNSAMVNVGIAASLAVPSDGVWRAASYYATPPTVFTELSPTEALPFASLSPPATTFMLWAVAYLAASLALALRSFARRDV